MIKLPLRLVPPTTENRTVTPTRRPNAAYRTREHLTQAEVERLIKAAGKNRWGHRDATMVLVAFRHGLRVVGTHRPSLGPDRLQRREPACPQGQEGHACDPSDPWRRAAGAASASAGAGSILAVRLHQRARLALHHRWLRADDRASWRNRQAGLQGPPHMLRHATGYALANAGHDTRALQSYLGHRNIQHTVKYTELAPTRFRDFFR